MNAHPEGGWYKEVYRSSGSIPHKALPTEFTGSRSYCTSIYFLLEKGQISAFHRIKSDEIWHFYAGHPLNVHIIHPDGKPGLIKLGRNYDAGESLQAVVPAGCWFGSFTEENYSLVGCTVAPGFDFGDFEMAERQILLEKYPDYSEIILKLTH